MAGHGTITLRPDVAEQAPHSVAPGQDPFLVTFGYKNANLRAHKSTALAGVGFGSHVGRVGMAPPKARFCVLSRWNDQASVLGAPGLSPYGYLYHTVG